MDLELLGKYRGKIKLRPEKALIMGTGPIARTMRRRPMLATLTGALVTAGCLSGSRDSQQTALDHVGVVNRDQSAHTVDLRVRWDGDLVHDRRYDLPADDPTDDTAPSVVPTQTWPATPGQFTVKTRLPESDWQSLDPVSLEYPQCLWISVQIDTAGDLAIFHTSNQDKCDPKTQDSL
jgi:hypothetical protein